MLKLGQIADNKRLTLLLAHTRVTGVLSICLALLLTYLMRDTSHLSAMINWVVALAFLPFIRWLFFYRKINRLTALGTLLTPKHHAIMVCFLFLSGSLWGIGAYVFFPDKINIELFVTFSTFMVGITAGLLPSLVASLPAYLAFLFPMMLGIAIRIYQFEQYILLTSVVIYFLYLVSTAFRLNKTILKAINTDVENEVLLTQVTQEKALAFKRAQNIEQLLANKKQLLADVSHELRTPLAVIKIYLEALVDGIEQDKDSYPIMQRKVDQLERLIQDIYLLSKTDVNQFELTPEDITIEHLLDEVIGTFTPLADQQSLSLTVHHCLQNETTVNGDWLRLIQAISNVLQNSIHYTNRGGNIKVSTYKQDQGIIIQVDDSAPSVPVEQLDMLFERFYRVESSRNRATGGSGLGLSIVKVIIEAHQGSISIAQSNLGGLSIKIHLPSY